MSSPSNFKAHQSSSDLVAEFRAFLVREDLKGTRQRDLIVEVFAGCEGHVSVDELLVEVARRDSAIGYATVYRTLKLLAKAGLASVREFGDGQSRYEVHSSDHHDHLICAECGYVVEFRSPELEKLQAVVAKQHGFTVESHRHELYGDCEDSLAGRPCPRRESPDHEAQRVRPPRVGNPPRTDNAPTDVEDLPAAFRRFLTGEHLKATRQRDLIAEVFAGSDDHISVDDLLAEVREKDRQIGYATVYRTLRLLVQAGLAAERRFGDGHTRYERRDAEHHDHMICRKTGRIIEFVNEEIEELQEAIAHKHGFLLTKHRHELHGFLDDAESSES